MDYKFLANTSLFKNIEEENIKILLSCLNAHVKVVKKNEIIFNTGDEINEIGLILSGSVNLIVYFYRGNSNIFHHVKKGEIFGESYANIEGQKLLGDIVASDDSEILFLNPNKIKTLCPKKCDFHNTLIENLIHILLRKNLSLSNRMIHIGPKTIKNKLFSYFSEQSFIHDSFQFTIPFSRQQLADYLNVDRSALSKELSKLQKEGYIKYKKNEFHILSKGEKELL